MTLADGAPIWFELTTPDPAAAAAFYEAVIGWTVQPSPMPEHGGYRIATAADGEGVAGLMSPPPTMPAGAPTGWSIYVLTHDLDALLPRAKAAGGRVAVGPMAIPHVGRFAVLIDPQGARLSVMQPDRADPGRPFKQMPDAHGHAVWIELATPDPDGAFAFYGALFGWTREGAMPMGDLGDYAFLGGADGSRPGAVMSSTRTGAPVRWNSYVLVPDIDAAIGAAGARGGTLIQGPNPIPGGDYSATIVDCHGHQIGLVGARGTAG